MGVNIELERRGVGRGERDAELNGAPPVRGEVGAGNLQAAGRRQRHLRVAEARGEARRRPIHWPLMPNQISSSSLIGGVQMPPISPRV